MRALPPAARPGALKAPGEDNRPPSALFTWFQTGRSAAEQELGFRYTDAPEPDFRVARTYVRVMASPRDVSGERAFGASV